MVEYAFPLITNDFYLSLFLSDVTSFQNSSGKFKTPNGFIGLPYHVSQGSGCQMRGQTCYVEVSLGCPRSGSDNALHPMRYLPKIKLLNLLLLEEVIRRDCWINYQSIRKYLYIQLRLCLSQSCIHHRPYLLCSLKRYTLLRVLHILFGFSNMIWGWAHAEQLNKSE